MKLLPQRPAFTTVNQSTCDNKQKKETGTVRGPLQFMTSLDSNICQNANLLWCDCNSYLAGRPCKRKYKRCGKAVAAGRVFCQVKAIDQRGSKEERGGWVGGSTVQRKLQVWGRENTITSQVKQIRLRWWRWIEGQHSNPCWRSPPRSLGSSLSLLLLLLLPPLGQTSGRTGRKEVTKRSGGENVFQRWVKKVGWTEVRRRGERC